MIYEALFVEVVMVTRPRGWHFAVMLSPIQVRRYARIEIFCMSRLIPVVPS